MPKAIADIGDDGTKVAGGTAWLSVIVPRVSEDHFGEDVAARYDHGSGPQFDPEVIRATVDLLADLAGGGAVLEFAIGTGRVALPLAARGLSVSGVELSPAMVRRLRAKDGAEQVDVTIGDMATTRVGGSFRLVYLVYNTIGNLTTQDEQVACFANAAAQLEDGGLNRPGIHGGSVL